MHGRLRAGAHALMGIAMLAMVWPAVPGWLCLAASAGAAVFFLGTALSRRKLVDLHHVAMAFVMVWMAAMPQGPVPCHGGAGPVAGPWAGAVAGAAAGYFWLAAAPFLVAPFRIGSRDRVLGSRSTGGSLGQAAMSLAMAVFLTIPLSG
jgi:hypothetical protein